MDPDDLDPGELATSALQERRKGWDLWQVVVGAGLAVSLVWTRCFGIRRMPFRLQVPYVPSSAKQVENMMLLLEKRSGKLVDLGSGDGRIVVEAYRCGFRPAIGYELNPWLVSLSNIRAWRAGCYGKVCFCQEDLWKVDLSDCRNVTVFLAPGLVPLLERKLLAELPEDACVVVARFPFLKWTPSEVTGNSLERVWAYDIGAVRQAQQGKIGRSPVQVTKMPFGGAWAFSACNCAFSLRSDTSRARHCGRPPSGDSPCSIWPARRETKIHNLHGTTTSVNQGLSSLKAGQSTMQFFASEKVTRSRASGDPVLKSNSRPTCSTFKRAVR